MQKTKVEQFYASLRSTGSYSTPPERRRAKRVRPSAWNTFRYTIGVTKVFPYCALREPFGLLTTEKWASACFSSVTTAEKLGINVIIEGFDVRQKHDGPVVYLCNHMSTTETILLMPTLLAFGPFSYVATAPSASRAATASSSSRRGRVRRFSAARSILRLARSSPRRRVVPSSR